MKNDYAIVVKEASKSFYIEKPKSLKKIFRNMFSPYKKLDVIKNFSINVKKGEVVLMTGPNGCGKTTLLKLIAGITKPDRGYIKTSGRLIPLIELGAGFNSELTGLENIIVNASIFGINKDKIRKIIPHIIRYSGLDKFIEVPIKRYSSGMVTRLAFSIGIFSEPEIMLLDEIFAVGDANFREKSFITIEKLKKHGVAIILSSHFPHEMAFVDKKIEFKKRFGKDIK